MNEIEIDVMTGEADADYAEHAIELQELSLGDMNEVAGGLIIAIMF